MTIQPRDLNAVMAEFRNFHHEFETLLMATCNAQGEPDASYAPYVEHLGYYYIYISELATHTENLQATGQCSLLFIEDEGDAKHVFARRRVTLKCAAEEIPRESTTFDTVLDLFVERFGKFMDMMRKLNDFHLFRLKPQSGGYVAGFAQAYTLGGEGLTEIRHRNEKGHRSPDKATASEMDDLRDGTGS